MTARSRPYQRRRRAPVYTVVIVLAVAALATWTTVLINASSGSASTSCPAPAAGPAPGEALPSGALDAVPPIPASAVKVRVLNAGGQRGQANLVAAQFGDLGFAQAAVPDNDPFFPKGDMTCRGQIRFGAAGQGAASTVSLVLPCVQLIRDGRADDSVDVSVGTSFGDVNPAKAAREALDQLAAPATGDTGSANADPSGGSAAPAAPAVDQATLAAAREATCG
jgi:LytR cell envelope-related transcriptional attenuator